MPDNDKLIGSCEDEIWQIINRMHKAGVRYEIVFGIFQEITKTLEVQGYCEQWLARFNKNSAPE